MAVNIEVKHLIKGLSDEIAELRERVKNLEEKKFSTQPNPEILKEMVKRKLCPMGSRFAK